MLTPAHKKFAVRAIEALGGTTKVAELFGLDERVVSNWRLRGLPPDTYDAMAPMLRELGRDAPPLMFRQRMIVRKKVVRPPRHQNGKAARR